MISIHIEKANLTTSIPFRIDKEFLLLKYAMNLLTYLKSPKEPAIAIIKTSICSFSVSFCIVCKKLALVLPIPSITL